MSGIVVGLAYLPYKIGFLAFVGFIPIIHLWAHNSHFENGKFGLMFGIIYNLISNYWIAYNSGTSLSVAIFSLMLTVIYLSTFWYILGFIIGILKHKINLIIYSPFLVVLLEWARSFGPLGYSWGNLALTLTDYTSLIQTIEYGGTYLISFIIISINLIFYFGLINKRKIYFIVSFLIIFGLHISGISRIKIFEKYSKVFSIRSFEKP